MDEWRAAPGTLPGIRRGGLVVVTAGPRAVEAARALLRARPDTAEEALTVLTADGITAAPDFVAVGAAGGEAGALQAYVRGALVLRTRDDAWREQLIDGRGARTWREVAVPHAAQAWIGPAPTAEASAARTADEPARLIGEGAFEAGALTWTADAPSMLAGAPASAPTVLVGDAFPDDLFGRADHESGIEETQQVREFPLADPANAGGRRPDRRVSAVLCATGHPNPPQRQRCARCGDALEGGRVTAIAPPSVGRILLPDGREIALAETMIIGRAPRAERTGPGRVPTLVTVASPAGDVSRSHLRLRVEGWSVLAEDLSSTNGTVLRRPDGSRRILAPGEPAVIVDGDAADLGGGALVRFVEVP